MGPHRVDGKIVIVPFKGHIHTGLAQGTLFDLGGMPRNIAPLFGLGRLHTPFFKVCLRSHCKKTAPGFTFNEPWTKQC